MLKKSNYWLKRIQMQDIFFVDPPGWDGVICELVEQKLG
jgi:hypothetical protein